MISLSSFQSYNILFNSLKQLPSLNSSGFSNVAGAYMATKYGRSINRALSSDLGTVMKNFRTDALALSKSAKTLTEQTDRLSLKTKDEAATGFSINGQFKAGSTLRIDQLASKQTNQGTPLKANQKTDIASGRMDLTLTSGNRSYGASVTIQAGESNSSLLSKTAKAINGLDAGVSARVASDALGNQQLVIESDDTGKSNGFSISGELSDALGLDQVTQTAADAKYNYNGRDYQNDSNSVKLDYGKTTLELKKTTAAAVTLDHAADVTDMTDRITNLVSAYNSFQDTLKTAPDNKALTAYSQQLEQLVSKNSPALEAFGISQNFYGELEIDAKKLAQKIEDNPEDARDLFVENGSLSQQLVSKAEQLLKTPASTLLDLPNMAQGTSPYQIMNSGLVNQLGISAQSSGNLFDLLL